MNLKVLDTRPLPWRVDGDFIRAANGLVVLDWADANWSVDLAEFVVNKVNGGDE